MLLRGYLKTVNQTFHCAECPTRSYIFFRIPFVVYSNQRHFMMATENPEKQEYLRHDEVVAKGHEASSQMDDYRPGTAAEKKLVRKIDLFLLPMMWLMYLLSYMDRTK